MDKIVSFLDQSNRYEHLVGDTDERHNTGIKAKRDGKPVQKEKKLETTAKSVDLTDAFRPKRNSAPGGTVVRFHRNATELRAKRIGENKQIFCQNKQKFCRVNIFHAHEAICQAAVASRPENSGTTLRGGGGVLLAYI